MPDAPRPPVTADDIAAVIDRLHDTGGIYAIEPAERDRIAAAVLALLAERWTPPPAGDRAEQLPDRVLRLFDVGDYTSTACDLAARLDVAARVYPDRADELAAWAEQLRARCRITNKFTGVRCRAPHHAEETP